MALNLYRTLHQSLIRKCAKFLHCHSQRCVQAAVIEESNKVQNNVEKAENSNKFSISSNHRTTPFESLRVCEPESEMMRRNVQNQYLQPATMPFYRNDPIFDNKFMATLQEEPIRKAQTIVRNHSASQEILESFKRKQAQNLPTRFPRLTSNPFPEPIKAIFSPFTMSDQDKADQMYQDQQMLRMRSTRTSEIQINPYLQPSRKFFCTTTSQNEQQNMQERTNQMRFFSKKAGGNEVCKDDSKKKAKSCLPKRCNKITLKGCPPARPNTVCKQKNQEVHCKKVEAPYPSYSESCFMEPKSRRRECDLCPWNEKNNPNFKGKLKRPPNFYHTLCSPSVPKTTTTGSMLQGNFKDQEDCAPKWTNRANLSQLSKNSQRLPSLDFLGIEKSEIPPFRFSENKDLFEKIELPQVYVGNSGQTLSLSTGVFCKKGDRIIPDYPKDCDKPYHDKSKNCPAGLTRKKTKKDRLKHKNDPKK